MLAVGSEVELLAEKPVAGGRMLARYEGRVVFVRGAIPGERVRARVERLSRDLAHAIAIHVLTPAADRRAPPIDADCGGNAFAHIAYPRQLALKSEIVADAFARLAQRRLAQPIPVTASSEGGYRMRARFHVRDRRAGFYREGTHELCDPAASGQLLPVATDVVQAVAEVVDEGSGASAGGTSIELAENVAGDNRAIHVELRDEALSVRLAQLGEVGGITGLSWSVAADPREHIVSGSPFVFDCLDTAETIARLRRHVRAFFQGNRYLLSQLVARVLSFIPAGPVVDLYAGVGLFAAALASSRDDEVVAVEGDLISATDLTANAAACDRPFGAYHMAVEDFLRQSKTLPGDTFIVDPPRTGLSRDAAAGIRHHRPRRIVYVSCDVATLARDVKIFADAGYEPGHIEAFDLFPNTAHVETIAVLDRKSKR